MRAVDYWAHASNVMETVQVQNDDVKIIPQCVETAYASCYDYLWPFRCSEVGIILLPIKQQKISPKVPGNWITLSKSNLSLLLQNRRVDVRASRWNASQTFLHYFTIKRSHWFSLLAKLSERWNFYKLFTVKTGPSTSVAASQEDCETLRVSESEK